MNFELKQATEILMQTPYTLQRMLEGMSDAWTASSGDIDSWGVYDVVGHLIHAEETDWVPRAEIILGQGENRTFVPFDRTAHFGRATEKCLQDLLIDGAHPRNNNLENLSGYQIALNDLQLRGMHPELGEVTLEQLLATWVVHDLNHISQIARILAKKYDSVVGPWKEFLSVLK